MPLGSAGSSFERSVNETVNGLCQVWLWVRVRMREAIAQPRDLLFTTQSSNGVKCVKYICMKLPYVAQQVGNVYFYRLTEIKELSGSLWWMHEERNLLKPVAGCRLFSHVDRASLKFGIQGMITDSCYFFSLPRVSIQHGRGFFGPQHSCYKGSLLYYCKLELKSWRQINIIVFTTHFPSPTNQKFTDSSTYWQFFHYRPPGKPGKYKYRYTAGNIAKI